MKKHDEDPPACVECIHYAEHFCYSDDCSQFDNIDGRRPVTAKTARDVRWNTCGPTAKFFEPRPVPSWLASWANHNASLLGMAALCIFFFAMALR